jgi:ABC-type nitrate/sulfonate/bicarbonate transport system ATPase subunit
VVSTLARLATAMNSVGSSISTPKLRVAALTHSYDSLPVLEKVSLTLHHGELVALVGPSGCGKSTILSILTGAITPHSGRIDLDGTPIARDTAAFAYMPQSDALLPWRRVIDNVTLGLEMHGVRRGEARARVTPLLATFGLDGFARAYPFQLSGGMRQRAALLRTVVQERSIMLLDEPFGALDALSRIEMQTWLEDLWNRHSWSTILITHDIREAVFLADRIYVLSPRPARVIAEVQVPLPRPRSLQTMSHPDFVGIEVQLRDALTSSGAL